MSDIVVIAQPLAITLVVQPQVVATVLVGIQGPAGAAGITIYGTTAEMFLVTGFAGQIAYCQDYPDQHYKWSTAQGTWVPAF